MALGAEERKKRNKLATRRYRERQTDAAREQRLQWQREYARRKRQSKISANRGQSPSVDYFPLTPVGDSTRQKVLLRLRKALGADGLDETICAVCDRCVLAKECEVIEISNRNRLTQMRSLLTSDDEDIPSGLIAEYDCSSLSPTLRGMFLSQRGVDVNRSIPSFVVCNECGCSLDKCELPKFAIKNGFFVGALPRRFADTSVAERYMVQPVSVVAMSRVMRGGAHRSIRSHCLAFDASPGPPATLLPRRLDGVSEYRVVLAGPFTDEQRARVKKMYRVRRQRVEDLLHYYKDEAKNIFFAEIAVDCSDLEPETTPSGLFDESAHDGISRDIGLDHDRVTDVADEAFDKEDEVIERRVVFSEDCGDGTIAQVVDISGDSATQEPRFLVRHSSQFAQDDGVIFAKMFPHLFPYGRGHPGEERKVPVSLHACIQYYAALSSRMFAEDELFTLVAFDRLSMKNMYLNVGLRCKRNPEVFDGYRDISATDLEVALRENERRRQGRVATSRNPSTAMRFLRSVELSESCVWGSDTEREQCRRKAFAYQARFGLPALFVTLTPNVSNSFVMAQYTGITSVDTLFDSPLSNLPDPAVLRAAALKNDFASARLFMRNMDAFVEHVLGIPLRQMRNKPFDGLFGPVKAYFGMIETQGGGTLHAHFLIWLMSTPPNVPAYKKALEERGDDFLEDIERYADSVVKTALPLDISQSTCKFCGGSYSHLHPLEIHDKYRTKAQADDGVEEREPAILECGQCSTSFSSQHVLRQVLLQNRPATWPPPMQDLDSSELEEKVSREARTRGSFSDTRLHIYERELLLHWTYSDDDLYGDFLDSINDAQGISNRETHDDFRRDEMARIIEMMPPSRDDIRWAAPAYMFMVSVLVFLLNLHWWSHAASCFKSSRSAPRGSCRYGYPRDRVERTSFTAKGLQLQRDPACEYINGFNDVMMATFKSNHDVQVLIGGEAVIDRIYYCCNLFTPARKHPLSRTHCVGKHRSEVVPVITGIRMPFVDQDSSDDVVVKRCKTSLALFKPFRNVADLVDNCTSTEAWKEAYSAWEPGRSLFVREIMDNMDDFFRAREKASLDINENDASSLLGSDLSDDEIGDFEEFSGDIDGGLEPENIPNEESGAIDDLYPTEDAIPDTDTLNPMLYPSSHQRCDVVDTLVDHELLVSTAQLTADKHGSIQQSLQVGDELVIGDERLSVGDLRKWVADSQTDDSLCHQRVDDSEHPTEVIELLSEALRPENMAWSSDVQGLQPESIGPYASIQSISRAKGLNERQHIAFCIAGKALLNRFYQQELAKKRGAVGYGSSDYETRLRGDQLLMFFGGAGGTGKTRVIDAITALCASWNRDDAMIKTALTGKAATLIHGRTLASLLLRLKFAIDRREFFDLDMVAIDEISMMTKKDWIKLDKLLRRYKKLGGIPFGGVHIILVGDFLQMPPVRSDPIYVDPSQKRNATAVDIAGFNLWRLFTSVIVLEESMRFKNDPEWGEGCRRARLGEWTTEFIRLINSRMIDDVTSVANAGKQTVFVTPENLTRLSINNAFVAEAAALLPTHRYPVRVVADFRKKLDGLSKQDIQMIMELPDNRFGRLAPYLDLIAGMPIQVTQNVATMKGVANGTLGTLEHIQFPRGTKLRLARDSTSNVVVQMPSRPPDYVLVRVPRVNAVSIRAGISPDLFPVFYTTEAYKECNISLPPAPNGQRRKLAVKIRQLPLVCAAGSTIYKVQGETLESMVVVDWKSKVAIVNKPQQVYLVVSRVTSRDVFLTLTRFTDDLAAWAKPPDDALVEEGRLVDLSNATMASWK